VFGGIGVTGDTLGDFFVRFGWWGQSSNFAPYVAVTIPSPRSGGVFVAVGTAAMNYRIEYFLLLGGANADNTVATDPFLYRTKIYEGVYEFIPLMTYVPKGGCRPR
jgi:hypothetical protein